MEDNKDALMAVPYIALESAQARHERTTKRFIIALIAVVVMLFASNLFWVYEWTQYDYETGEEVSLDAGDGGNAVALAINGEPRLTSRAIYVPAAADDYGNVTSTAIIKVPKCCCFSLSVDAVPASLDPTVTPAPSISVQNANLTISRIA